MAQKKFKFKIENQSQYTLDIGGGRESNVRLLVALPHGVDPSITVPVGSKYTAVAGPDAVPPNEPVSWTDQFDEFTPSRLTNGNRTFGVDPSWDVYLYPPIENKLIEDVSGGMAATFPTYIDDTELSPGETFSDPSYGKGSWVFYVPMTEDLFEALSEYEDSQPVILAPSDDGEDFTVVSDGPVSVPRAVTAQAINVIGVAVVNPLDSSIIGFSPAPPDSTYTQADLF